MKPSTSHIARSVAGKVPQHIAIIMDGNGRWAQQHGQSRSYGHEQGVKAIREVVSTAASMGVKTMTLYAFSEENWQRPELEVRTLMELICYAVEEQLPFLMQEQVRLRVIGEWERLPEASVQALRKAIQKTDIPNTRFELILAINYAGRSEIIRAAEALRGTSEPITAERFEAELYYPTTPPDLLIRTGGEKRVSNFLLWQMAYTEFFFTSCYWPDFGKAELEQAIAEYERRERRFGQTGEQVQAAQHARGEQAKEEE